MWSLIIQQLLLVKKELLSLSVDDKAITFAWTEPFNLPLLLGGWAIFHKARHAAHRDTDFDTASL
jgi:hypothetical protein